MNQSSEESSQYSIVGNAVYLNNQFKEKTGIDLLQESPQALAQLCIADAIENVSNSLDKVADNIGYAPDPANGMADITDSIYKGLRNVANAIEKRSVNND
ncbi:hypothetical protein [Nitrosomonas sp.]|uniref:hypothetical protein n=1 Tax=Nitrosomonas sp. TaxID=42353 RepID=UPI00207FC324|nr:hypothetical protein [Nitrosomonas sp.]GJL76085.1 MAG: hypothetical protein NMNS02_21910 [Nitrosomonas sp.]